MRALGAFIVSNLLCGAVMAAPLSFSEIPGWVESDHAQTGASPAQAWQVFRTSCGSVLKIKAANREQTISLQPACTKAVQMPEKISDDETRRFFEANFEPVKLTNNADGLMTGYYEPEFEASQKQSAAFPVPVLRRPKDLVSEVAPSGHPELKAARKLQDGSLMPYPDRAAIENGALKDQHLELFYMRDPFDLFTMQVQGSGRLKLENGKTVRLAYDGKNGQPYTSVGKVLIERGLLKKGSVTMQAIGAVFKKDPQLAREIMRENKSYVFFRELRDHSSASGPLGAQGVPLTPLLSIAVDSDTYAYGLPFFIDGAMPTTNHVYSFQQLAIAQDTGTAIKGKARIDLFMGSGNEAAEAAGVMQQRVDLYLLRPKPQ